VVVHFTKNSATEISIWSKQYIRACRGLGGTEYLPSSLLDSDMTPNRVETRLGEYDGHSVFSYLLSWYSAECRQRYMIDPVAHSHSGEDAVWPPDWSRQSSGCVPAGGENSLISKRSRRSIDGLPCRAQVTSVWCRVSGVRRYRDRGPRLAGSLDGISPNNFVPLRAAAGSGKGES